MSLMLMTAALSSILTGAYVTREMAARHLENTAAIAHSMMAYQRSRAAGSMARDIACAIAIDKAGTMVEDLPDHRLLVPTPGGGVTLSNPWEGEQRYDAESATWTLGLPEEACPGLLAALPPDMLSAVGTGAGIDRITDWSPPPKSPVDMATRCSGVHAVAMRFRRWP